MLSLKQNCKENVKTTTTKVRSRRLRSASTALKTVIKSKAYIKTRLIKQSQKAVPGLN